MKFDDVIKHFGNIPNAAAALGVSNNRVRNWRGYAGCPSRVPGLWQLRIEQLTAGALRAEANVLTRKTVSILPEKMQSDCA
jgi:hypothetical protein